MRAVKNKGFPGLRGFTRHISGALKKPCEASGKTGQLSRRIYAIQYFCRSAVMTIQSRLPDISYINTPAINGRE